MKGGDFFCACSGPAFPLLEHSNSSCLFIFGEKNIFGLRHSTTSICAESIARKIQ